MPKGNVVMVSLFNAIYPPLARQAGISGDVELKLGIRRDGSIESAAAVSGHAMLTQAALNSAQQSQFECRGCEDEVTSHTLVYSFQFAVARSRIFRAPKEMAYISPNLKTALP
jgi:TonB family protein